MNSGRKDAGIDRRQFLAATGGSLLAAAVPGSSAMGSAGVSRGASGKPQTPERHEARKNMRKIPIGVVDPVYGKMPLEQMLDIVIALGLEAMEVGTGGYPENQHCPLDELIEDAGKAN